MSAWEAAIGLEVHVQLATRTKLFCGDATTFGAPPNTLVCPVCLGLPGALPVTNRAAVELGVRAALALECTIHEVSGFARKNYFYPDLPRGYQITQYERPLATGGQLLLPDGSAAVRIRRVHLEEDAGRLLHDRFAGATAVDFNRAGVPLIEIVTEPDLRTPHDARRFLDRLKQTLQYIEVSDCDMEKGSLRVDANVSVRAAGSGLPGTKTEVKNMNSFAGVERALAHEIARQLEIVSSGRRVVQETLLWDASRGEVRRMRAKEESHDYRYFPEPDLPPLVIEPDHVDAVARALPEMPGAREGRLREQYDLSAYDAAVLTADRGVADYFEAVAAAAGDGKAAANWVMTEVLRWLNRRGLRIADVPVHAVGLGALIRMVVAGEISNSAARRIFPIMAQTGRAARDIVAEEGLQQIGDPAQLEEWAAATAAAHPSEVERYRAGETRVLGFLMGQLMKRSAGRADPRLAAAILQRRLEM